MSANRRLAIQYLIFAQRGFAGIGTKTAKLTLNRLGKTSAYARALRVALEAEDQNLTAKRYFGGDIGGMTYADVAYR
jgi:hypothetical protein